MFGVALACTCVPRSFSGNEEGGGSLGSFFSPRILVL